MERLSKDVRHVFRVGVGVTGLLVAWFVATAAGDPVGLSGSQEVPPVSTTATGVADVSVVLTKCPAATSSATDCPTVVGTVSVSGAVPTAVHVHLAPAGQNGPVIVTLVPRGDSVWTVPPATTISRDQYQAWWDGNCYVNVHTAANPGGEIRAQLKR